MKRFVVMAEDGKSKNELEVKEEETKVVTSVADAASGPSTGTEMNEEDRVTERAKPAEHQAVEPTSPLARYMPSDKVLIIARNGIVLFLGITFMISLFKTVRKFLSPKAKRRRTVNKNKELVENLIKYLPHRREELTEKAVWMIRMKTGFTPTEVFRKYLWFLLRERKFDQSAVDDLICLKKSLQLSEEDVATALRERSQRVYEKYGSLMLNTEGMTSAGIERKATCQALFSKLLYLSEHESLLDQESDAAKDVSLGEIFGATEEDQSKLRIISLEEVNLDKLDQMIEASDPDIESSDEERSSDPDVQSLDEEGSTPPDTEASDDTP